MFHNDLQLIMLLLNWCHPGSLEEMGSNLLLGNRSGDLKDCKKKINLRTRIKVMKKIVTNCCSTTERHVFEEYLGLKSDEKRRKQR